MCLSRRPGENGLWRKMNGELLSSMCEAWAPERAKWGERQRLRKHRPRGEREKDRDGMERGG